MLSHCILKCSVIVLAYSVSSRGVNCFVSGLRVLIINKSFDMATISVLGLSQRVLSVMFRDANNFMVGSNADMNRRGGGEVASYRKGRGLLLIGRGGGCILL